MNKIYLLIILFITFGYSFLQSSSVPLAPSSSPTGGCVYLKGTIRDVSGQYALSFFNGCNERVWVNVCFKDNWGEYTLKKSFQRVPVGGTLNIYAFPGTHAESVQWTADPVNPPIPPACLHLKQAH